MGNGYMGKVLNVDLTAGTIEYEELPDSIYEEVLGGTGLAARLLYDRIPAGADPLGPDNVLAIMPGLLTGTSAQFSGRWMVAGRSPLTGGWGDANCGGNFSPAIKKIGVDGILVRGMAETPKVLQVIGDKAELVDAGELWGMDAIDAEKALLERVGVKGARACVIGTSGEKVSLISGVVNDGGRIAARSGLGAVMGSKKLKGVVLKGKEKVEVAERDGMKALNKQFMEWFNKGQGGQKVFAPGVMDFLATFQRVSPVALGYTGDMVKNTFLRYGTICTNTMSSETGDTPCQNWKGAGSVDFPLSTHSKHLNPKFIVQFEAKKYKCFNCPLGCGGHIVKQDGGRFQGEQHKPEYETCAALGALLLNKDLDTIFVLNDKLNRAGMDTISAGATVAFAMECYEADILSQEDLDGIDLRWGNADAVIEIIDKMIHRDGVGDLLADGVKVAAAKIGKGAEEFAMHAGGQELPMHDSRFDPGYGIAYQCEPTPGKHTNISYSLMEMFGLHNIFPSLPSMPGVYGAKKRKLHDDTKNTLLVAASKYVQATNACGMCLFGLQMGGTLPVAAMINAATGWEHEPEHYLEVGARIQALRQAFNVKHGAKPKSFKLPGRAWGAPPLDKGPLKNVSIPSEEIAGQFYDGMGWDRETGIPSRPTLEALGLAAVATDLENAD